MKYHNIIKRLAPAHDPRLIYAYVASWHRGEYIGSLSFKSFATDVADAAACVEMRGPVEAETIALSLGL